MVQTIFLYEFKKIKNAISFWLLLLIVFCIGILSLYNGSKTIAAQNNNITVAIEKEDAVFKGIVKQIQVADTSTEDKKWDYSHLKDASWMLSSPNKRWTTYNTPNAMAALSIGNRDVYPYYHEIEPLSFYMRFFKSEINNPLTQLIGSIDVAFVIVFLFPLLIIALTFNLQSSEIENGTFAFLQTASISTNKILIVKSLFYFLIVIALLTSILLCAGIFISSLNWSVLLQFLGSSILYFVFWFAGTVILSSYKKTSIQNIGFLLGLWIVLLIALPAIGNSIANVAYKVNSDVFSENIRRVQVKKDKKSMADAIQKFNTLHPEFAGIDTAAAKLFDNAYAVGGELNDQIGDSLWAIYSKQIIHKEAFIKAFNIYNPAVLTQLYFNKITHTDLDNYLQYVQTARQFAQQVKMDLLDKAIKETELTEDDFLNRKKFSTQELYKNKQ